MIQFRPQKIQPVRVNETLRNSQSIVETIKIEHSESNFTKVAKVMEICLDCQLGKQNGHVSCIGVDKT